MKKFKRILRLSGLICLIILASVGMGIGGAVPIPMANKKEDTIELIVESSDDDDEAELNELEIKG